MKTKTPQEFPDTKDKEKQNEKKTRHSSTNCLSIS